MNHFLRFGLLGFTLSFPHSFDCKDIYGGKQYLKFEICGLKFEGFMKEVKQWWGLTIFNILEVVFLCVKLRP